MMLKKQWQTDASQQQAKETKRESKKILLVAMHMTIFNSQSDEMTTVCELLMKANAVWRELNEMEKKKKTRDRQKKKARNVNR